MKRVFAIMLVLAMVLSLSIPALAAEETGSITITNATVGEDYAVYKIFDANIKLAADGKTTEAVAYSIETNNQFFEILFGDGTKDNTYFTYNSNTGAVAKKEGVNDSELIKYLEEIVKGGTYATAAKAEDVTSDEVKFEGLPYGYYMILSTLGATVTINSNTPNVKVIDKNQEPGSSLDKQVQVGVDKDGNPIWADANSANIGDKITYKISFQATNYDGDKQIQHYQIHDEKGDAIWAEFNSFKVVVGGVELPRGYYLSQGGNNTDNWEFLNEDSDHPDSWKNLPAEEKTRNNAQWYLVHLGEDQFRITIPWLVGHELKDVPDTQGNVVAYSLTYPENPVSKYDSPADVVITYDCVVEPGASIGSTSHGNRFNKAHATWTSESETGSTPPDEVVTNVYGLGLLKDDAATQKNLAGAKFRVYKDKDCTKPVYLIPTDIEGVYMVDTLGKPIESVTGSAMKDARELYGDNLVGYLEDGKEQDNYVVTPVNGKVIILGVAAGTYYLKEVEAPDGYNALSTVIELKAGEGMRSFNIFVDEKTGEVADIQQTDGIHTEKIYDLTSTIVNNSKGVELPSTGGKGTIMLITFGTLVAMGFAILLITQKKMSIYKG